MFVYWFVYKCFIMRPSHIMYCTLSVCMSISCLHSTQEWKVLFHNWRARCHITLNSCRNNNVWFDDMRQWEYWRGDNYYILFVYLNRTVPQVEVEAVSEFLFHLLTGDVDKLSTQTLVHKFWNFFSKYHSSRPNIWRVCAVSVWRLRNATATSESTVVRGLAANRPNEFSSVASYLQTRWTWPLQESLRQLRTFSKIIDRVFSHIDIELTQIVLMFCVKWLLITGCERLRWYVRQWIRWDRCYCHCPPCESFILSATRAR